MTKDYKDGGILWPFSLFSCRAPLPEPLHAVLGEEWQCCATKELEESGNKFYPLCLYCFLFLQVLSRRHCHLNDAVCHRQRIKDNQKHTARILWVVLKGEIEAPRMLAVPSSIPWSNPLLCCWRPEDDESTSGLRNLKVRSGPSTTIESLTKSFLKEKLVERLAPIVPCNWAVVVWNGQGKFELAPSKIYIFLCITFKTAEWRQFHHSTILASFYEIYVYSAEYGFTLNLSIFDVRRRQCTTEQTWSLLLSVINSQWDKTLPKNKRDFYLPFTRMSLRIRKYFWCQMCSVRSMILSIFFFTHAFYFT